MRAIDLPLARCALAAELALVRSAVSQMPSAESRQRAFETAFRPPLPYHLIAKREAQRIMRDPSRAAYIPTWAQQNLKESVVREALRAHTNFVTYGALA